MIISDQNRHSNKRSWDVNFLIYAFSIDLLITNLIILVTIIFIIIVTIIVIAIICYWCCYKSDSPRPPKWATPLLIPLR